VCVGEVAPPTTHKPKHRIFIFGDRWLNWLWVGAGHEEETGYAWHLVQKLGGLGSA